MTDPAENTEPQAGSNPPTAGGEPTIPKHRFDEVNGKIRALQEELRMKNELLQKFSQPAQAAPNPQDDLKAEDFGLDADSFKAVRAVAERIAQKEINVVSSQFRGHLARMANESEETRFLMQHGKDKEKYLEQIRQEKHRHYQRTGSYMDTETAYKLIRFDEMDSGRGTPPATPAPASAAPAPQAPATPPSAPSSSGKKSFSEMTDDERLAALEAEESELEKHFASQGAI